MSTQGQGRGRRKSRGNGRDKVRLSTNGAVRLDSAEQVGEG